MAMLNNQRVHLGDPNHNLSESLKQILSFTVQWCSMSLKICRNMEGFHPWIPSGNQTWQWKMDENCIYLHVCFPLTPPFLLGIFHCHFWFSEAAEGPGPETHMKFHALGIKPCTCSWLLWQSARRENVFFWSGPSTVDCFTCCCFSPSFSHWQFRYSIICHIHKLKLYLIQNNLK